MKVAVFKHKEERRIGFAPKDSINVLVDSVAASHLLKQCNYDASRDMMSLIQSWPDNQYAQLEKAITRIANDPSLAEMQLDVANLKLEAPLARPGKIICLAGNYRAHITESGYFAPEQTDVFTQQLFLKPSTCITGDGDPILFDKPNVMVGWETELAVVIGKRGKHIDPAQAYEYILGYTILNDVSERRLNSRIENRTKREMDGFLDWLAGKWFDSFAPCGPWIVTADEIRDPHDLDIKLTINGQTRQQGNTCDMIFKIPEQVAYISSIMTLEPGDIISTGTPVGAGVGGDSSLRDGDELVCEIEHIGSLRNTVRYVS